MVGLRKQCTDLQNFIAKRQETLAQLKQQAKYVKNREIFNEMKVFSEEIAKLRQFSSDLRDQRLEKYGFFAII